MKYSKEQVVWKSVKFWSGLNDDKDADDDDGDGGVDDDDDGYGGVDDDDDGDGGDDGDVLSSGMCPIVAWSPPDYCFSPSPWKKSNVNYFRPFQTNAPLYTQFFSPPILFCKTNLLNSDFLKKKLPIFVHRKNFYKWVWLSSPFSTLCNS